MSNHLIWRKLLFLRHCKNIRYWAHTVNCWLLKTKYIRNIFLLNILFYLMKSVYSLTLPSSDSSSSVFFIRRPCWESGGKGVGNGVSSDCIEMLVRANECGCQGMWCGQWGFLGWHLPGRWTNACWRPTLREGLHQQVTCMGSFSTGYVILQFHSSCWVPSSVPKSTDGYTYGMTLGGGASYPLCSLSILECE